MKTKKIVITGVLTFFLYFSTVQALMVMVSLAQKVDDADYIMVGQITDINSKREQYKPNLNLVMSTVKIQVLENWKGSLSGEVKIKSFGGVLGEVPYYSDNDPVFYFGGKVVLFLKNYDGDLFPLYHSQGVYHVNSDDKVESKNGTISDFKKEIVQFLNQ